MSRRNVTADDLAKDQRSISISEFFSRNSQLLGFDNPTRALLTTIKEAVDNSLDACESGRMLPDIRVSISRVGDSTRAHKNESGAGIYCVDIQDNGPGITPKQIPPVFGKLLYGSKFHKMQQSRGQQGIGISAAGMYGLMTTGKPLTVISRTHGRKTYRCEMQIDTAKNMPMIVNDGHVKRDDPSYMKSTGTRVIITLEGDYRRGRTGVEEYIRQTAIANPHATILFEAPNGDRFVFERAAKKMPPEPVEVRPHPYGIDMGQLVTMMNQTSKRSIVEFLHGDFGQISHNLARKICKASGLRLRTKPADLARDLGNVEALYKTLQSTKLRNPKTNVLVPIGSENMLIGMRKEIDGEFFESIRRSPTVYRGNPFSVEVGIAYGGKLSELSRDDSPIQLLRLANRVPLQYKQGDCCITKAVTQINWRNYGLSQKRGQLPYGPMALVVHVASVWVPFTSESKEAIADYDDIRREIKLAIFECARKLGTFLSKKKRLAREAQRKDMMLRYVDEIANACAHGIKSSRVKASKVRRDLLTLIEHHIASKSLKKDE